MRVERLERRILLASDVWVDDDWSGLAAGVDPDGAGPATEIGLDAFATVQHGIDGVDLNGFVAVNDGAYVEDVDVDRAVTLGGGFSLDGSLSLMASGAVLGDGSGPTLISSGSLSLTSGSILTVEVHGLSAGVEHNQYRVTGSVDLGGATLDAFGSIDAIPGDSVVLIDNDGGDAVIGEFAGIANGDLISINGQDFVLTYDGGDGNDVVLMAPSFDVVYVDDDWSGSANGADPDGPGPATEFGRDAFSSITDAVAAVGVGGTVHVFNGAYTETPILDRQVTLLAESVGGVDLDAGGASTGVTVASGVVASISGFDLSGFSATGIEAQGDLLLENSSLTGQATVGVRVAVGSLATLESVSLNDLGVGVEVAGRAVLTDSVFGASATNGVDVRIASTASSVDISGSNNFSAADYYIENLSDLDLDLTGSPASLFDETDSFRIEDRLYHAPDNGASGVIRVAAGQLFVTTPGTALSDETIQAAVNAAAPGDLISVEAGVFVEDLTIDTAGIELAGAGAGVTIVEGVATNPQSNFPLATPNINVLAGGVAIHDFTIRSPDTPAGQYASGLLIDSPDVEIYNNEFVSRQGDATPVGLNDGLTNITIQTWAGSSSGKASDIDGLSIHDNAFSGDGKGYHGIVVNGQSEPVVAAISIADNTLAGSIWRAVDIRRPNVVVNGNTVTPGAETLHAWGGAGVAVGDFAGDPLSGVFLTGNTIAGADGATGQGFADGVLIEAGAGESDVTIEANNIISDNDAGVRVNTGAVAVAGGVLSGNTFGLVVAGGSVAVNDVQFLGNGTGVLINAGAAASLTGETAAISGGEIGVDVDGGVALIEGYNLNSNTIGVRVQRDGRADLGQEGAGLNFTGLGVSVGGNDFSSYAGPASDASGAVVNLNTGGDYSTAGAQGVDGPAYFDVTARGNLFNHVLTTPAAIDAVVYHDTDDSGVGFVDFSGLQKLVVSLGTLPSVVTNQAIDEGGAVTLSGEFENVAQAHTVTINWGNGGPDTVIPLAAGAFAFSATSPAAAYDDDPDGPVQTASFGVTVLVEEVAGADIATDSTLTVDVENVAPIVPLADADGDNQIDEGEEFNLQLGPVIDPGADTISAYQIDWGDGTPLQFVAGDSLATAATRSHLYEDGLASSVRTITVDVLDEDGTWHAAGTLDISVRNIDPTATSFLPFDSTVDEGATTTVFFAEPFADPGAQDTPFRFAYDFNGNGVYGEAGELGDGAYAGSSTASFAVVPAQFLADDDDGPRTINGRIIDKDGGFTEYQLSIDIDNVAPIVDAGPADAAFVDVPVDHVVSFSDPGADQDWTVSIDWDGVAGFEETFTVSSRAFNLNDHSLYSFGAADLGATFTVTVQIDDNDGGVDSDSFELLIVEDTLQVVDLTVNPSGFDVRFNRAIDLSVLNLYNGFADSTTDAPDLVLVGDAVGSVGGSLRWDASANTLSFIKTGGVLQPDTYSLTLFSGAHTPAVSGSIAFQDASGADLDGDGDTVAGDDYVASFVVSPTPRVLGLPDFARGPGQAVDLSPTTTGPGTLELPITLSDANGVFAVDFDLVFDPAVLAISVPNNNVPLGPTMPSGWNALGNFISPGVLRVSVTGTAPLSGADLALIDLAATVLPTAKYGDAHVIRFENLRVNEGVIESIADRAFHKVVFVGDASGSGNYTGYDASLISRVLVGIDTGFESYDDTDPLIIADVTQDGTISGMDSSLVNREALNRNNDPLQIPEIPPVPAGGISHAPGLVDPQLSIPKGVLLGGAGGVVPVIIDILPLDEGGVIAATYTVQYDPGSITFQGAELGASIDSVEGWNIDYYEAAPGDLVISLYGTAPALPTGIGEISRLTFEATGSAETLTPLDIEPTDPGDAGLLWTSVDGSIDLSRVAGDYNADGRVDAADYTVWRDLSGSTVPAYTSADGDGDGLINAADHLVWRQNYGATLPPPAPVAALAGLTAEDVRHRVQARASSELALATPTRQSDLPEGGYIGGRWDNILPPGLSAIKPSSVPIAEEQVDRGNAGSATDLAFAARNQAMANDQLIEDFHLPSNREGDQLTEQQAADWCFRKVGRQVTEEF